MKKVTLKASRSLPYYSDSPDYGVRTPGSYHAGMRRRPVVRRKKTRAGYKFIYLLCGIVILFCLLTSFILLFRFFRNTDQKTDALQQTNPVQTTQSVPDSLPSEDILVSENSDSLYEPPTPAQALTGEPMMDVYFLGVYRSVCILCVSGDKCIMLDSGNTTDEEPRSIEVIKKQLEELQIKKIDCLVLSHGHGDHTGGAQVLLLDLISDPENAIQIGQVIYDFGDPNVVSAYNVQNLLAELTENRGMNIIETVPKTGDVFSFGNMDVKCILENEEEDVFNENEKENDDIVDDQSVIMKVELRGTDQSVLFMGDALGDLEQKLLERNADIHCSLLMLSHHGLSTSSLPEFLARTGALYGVACTGGWDLDQSLPKKCQDANMTFLSTATGTKLFHCKNGSTLFEEQK